MVVHSFKDLPSAPEPGIVVAAVLAQPSGFRPELPNHSYNNNMTGWGPELVKRRPDITMEMIDKFLNGMYRTDAWPFGSVRST